MDQDGVYPVLVNVNGAVDGDDQRRVGELSTFVVQQPVVPAARTAVAWLWPLVELPHRSASGGFRDDDLADSIGSGGRLDRALAVLERLPGTVPPGGTEPVPALPVTLAVDPALVEELTIMAAGPYAVGRRRGRRAAGPRRRRSSWSGCARWPTSTTWSRSATADVDADALVAGGLTDVLVRSLPGTGDGRPGRAGRRCHAPPRCPGPAGDEPARRAARRRGARRGAADRPRLGGGRLAARRHARRAAVPRACSRWCSARAA